MLTYPHFNPVLVTLGPIQVHWYGIMYLIGFASAWVLSRYRCKRPWSPITRPQVDDVIFYGALGVVLGGRIGYVLFYNFFNFIHSPWVIFEIWDGGMSFHGGLLGVMAAEGIYCKLHKINFADLMDFLIPMVPIGLGAGRFGNFINGELWGRVTDSPIGMVFPTGGPWPRYPSQLIEMALEGVVMFIILWTVSLKPRPRGFMIALFLICYGSFRCIAEFFRQPDAQIGFIFGWMTEGQLLSMPMIIIGVGMLIWVLKKNNIKT